MSLSQSMDGKYYKQHNEGEKLMSEMTQISAKIREMPDKIYTIEYEFGDTLQEMVEKFGEDVVRTNARANMIIAAQSRIRTCLKANKTQDETTEIMKSWKPGTVSSVISDPLGSFEKFFEAADPQKQRELLNALKQKLAALA